MSVLYRSERIGKNGKPFTLYKFRTLQEGSERRHFAEHEAYVFMGRFLRKTKLDELPQLWNFLKGDVALVGPRPEEKRVIEVIPSSVRDLLLSVKPGLTSLSSIHFFDEEKILQQSADPFEDYWKKVKPMKITLDVFYVQNKCYSLDLWILWQTFKKILVSLFK